MSRLTSLSLWGRFFRLNSTLDYNSSNGYQVTSAHRIRQPINHKYFQYFPEECPDGVILSSNVNNRDGDNLSSKILFSDKVDTKLLGEIEKELEKKIQIWDFEFDIFTEIRGASVDTTKINLQSCLHKAGAQRVFKNLNTSRDAVAGSILNSPIIGEDFNTLRINNYLIEEYVKKIILALDKNTELLVLTGELIWSGFMHISHIAKLIQEKINRDIDIVLDLDGVWRHIIYLSKFEPEVLKFTEKYFKADIRYIASTKKLPVSKRYKVFKYNKNNSLHQIVLIKNRVSLYDLGANARGEESNALIPQIILFRDNSKNIYFNQEPNRFDQWWKTPKYYNTRLTSSKIKYLPFAKRMDQVFKMDQPQGFTGKLGGQLKPGELIGKIQKFEYKVLDYQRIGDLSKYMLSIDGQIVKKGEIIAKVPKIAGLITSVIKTPINGRLDLSMVKDGFIKIYFNKTWIKQKSYFDGKIVGLRKDKTYEVSTKATSIFGVNYIPNDKVSGILRKSVDDVNPDEKNILVLHDLSEFKYSADEIRDLNITGIICESASYKDYYNFISDSNTKTTQISVVIMSRFNELSSEAYAYLKQYLGYFVFIDDGMIHIPLVQFGDFLQSDMLSEHVRYGPSEGTLGKGQRIKYLAYDTNMHYAIIENIQNNSVLVNNFDYKTDALSSVNINNIIIINNE